MFARYDAKTTNQPENAFMGALCLGFGLPERGHADVITRLGYASPDDGIRLWSERPSAVFGFAPANEQNITCTLTADNQHRRSQSHREVVA